MCEWTEEFLGHLTSIEIGGTPAREIAENWLRQEDDGHPWVSIADLGPRIVFDTKERITDLGVRNSNVKRVPRGTLMMSFKLTIGRTGFAGTDLYTNEAIAAFVPKDKRIDGTFLYYVLPGVARSAITDTAVKGVTLNKQKLRDLLIRFPQILDEQKRIAEILSTVDEAIEQTEALIAKTQRIKAGLMHDLFTRGVTPDGQLRPPREEAPRLYKESPLGWIPREWVNDSLSEFLQGGPKNGYSPPEITEWAGMYALGLGCLTLEGFQATQLKAVRPDAAGCRGALLRDGDLLFSRSNTRDLVGLAGIFKDVGAPCIYPDLMMRIMPNRRTSPEFLESLLLSPLMRLQITAAAVGTSGSMVKLRAYPVVTPTYYR